jgi:hypothetical protein
MEVSHPRGRLKRLVTRTTPFIDLTEHDLLRASVALHETTEA